MDNLGAFCCMVACLLIFALWTAFIFPFKPKIKHFFKVWLGLPALALGLLILTGYAFSAYQSLPCVVYRDIVGSDPPPDVTFVNALRHMPIDWDDSYLGFTASDSTIELILQDGFVSIEPFEVNKYGCTPRWWQPPAGPDVRAYSTKLPDPDFGYDFDSHKLLIYASSDGSTEKRTVYMRYRR